MKTIIILSLCLLYAFTLNAYNIQGTATSDDGTALEFSNVTVLTPQDSTLVTSTVSIEDGRFALSLPQGNYIVRITCLGYKPHYSNLDVNADKDLGRIALKTDAAMLGEVTVTATRPTVKRTATGMVVSVDGVKHLQNKSLDRILNMSPGVFIDRDGNISINGNGVSQVIVNDKTLRLTGDQLIAYLKSIQGSDIKEIEIKSNPSSAEDAEGSGGVIKITTNRKREIGVTGYASMNYSIATRPTYNPTVGLAWSLGNITIYGNYSYINRRNTWKRSTVDYYSSSHQVNYNAERWHDKGENHSYRMGLDWQVNGKHYIGIEYSGGCSKPHNIGSSSASVYLDDNLSQLITTTSTFSNSPHNNQFSINYVWQIDTIGQTLKFVADYGNIVEDDGSTSDFANVYYDGSGNLNDELNKRERSDEAAKIYSAKLDYEKPFIGSKWKLSAGAKLSHVRNNYNYLMLSWHSGEQPVEDTRFTDRFRFTELLCAAYANVNYSSDKLDGNAGLRAEYTDREGVSYVQDERNTATDLRLFPSAFMYWKPTATHGVIFYYGLRINRPSYQDLNPFVSYLTDLSYKMGNPNLKPEISNAIELTYVLKNKYYMSARVNIINDRIRDYTFTNGEYVAQTMTNLSGYKWYYFNLYAPFDYKIWNSSVLLNVGMLDSRESSGMRSRTFAMDFTWDNYLYFNDNLSCQFRVLYSPPYRDVYQDWHRHIFQVGVSADYSFGKGKWMLSAGVDDLFNMLRHRSITYTYPQLRQEARIDGKWQGRTFYVALKFNFSTERKAIQKQKERSNQEEIKRL